MFLVPNSDLTTETIGKAMETAIPFLITFFSHIINILNSSMALRGPIRRFVSEQPRHSPISWAMNDSEDEVAHRGKRPCIAATERPKYESASTSDRYKEPETESIGPTSLESELGTQLDSQGAAGSNETFELSTMSVGNIEDFYQGLSARIGKIHAPLLRICLATVDVGWFDS